MLAGHNGQHLFVSLQAGRLQAAERTLRAFRTSRRLREHRRQLHIVGGMLGIGRGAYARHILWRRRSSVLCFPMQADGRERQGLLPTRHRRGLQPCVHRRLHHLPTGRHARYRDFSIVTSRASTRRGAPTTCKMHEHSSSGSREPSRSWARILAMTDHAVFEPHESNQRSATYNAGVALPSVPAP